jgi:hypothetical protein
MVANVAGAVAWVGTDCLLAYNLGKEVAKLAGPVGLALAVAVIAGFVLLGALIVRHEKRLAVAAENALPGPLRSPPAKRAA